MARVALNLLYLDPGKTGGMEVVARDLIPELAASLPDDWSLSAIVNRRAAQDSSGPWHQLESLRVVDVDIASRPAWVKAEMRAVPAAARALGADLLHSFGNLGPWRPGLPQLITVNDLIHHAVTPPAAPLQLGGRTTPLPDPRPVLHRRITGGLVVGGAKRATRVAVSATQTAEDLGRFAGIARSRIDVIPYGIAPPAMAPVPEAELRARFDLGDRQLVLSPSARQPHKNLDRLLQAHAALEHPRPLLVLPGYATAQDEVLRARAEQLGITDDVRMLGWVEQDELEGLYAASTLLVFPSLYEGFGLPVLEAMLRGLPVACSNRGSLDEVAGDAALEFDPEQPTEIAAAIQRLTRDEALRDDLIERGRAQAARFTWSACAAGYLASYQRTLGLPAAARSPLTR